MIIKDLTLSTPAENILFDEALFALAEESGTRQYIRFWESTEPFVVLGRIGQLEKEVKLDAVRQDGIKVLRRASGGGTVVQGKGCMNFTFVLQKNKELDDLKRSYQNILSKVLQALKLAGVEGVFHPISDLALEKNGLKFSGNAQKRGRKFILHHGTILCHFDLPLIEKYLKMPESMPDYRKGRGHLDFVSNIDVDPCSIKKNITAQYGECVFSDELTAEEKKLLSQLMDEKRDITEVIT